MGAPVKRKREQEDAPAASSSSQPTKKAVTDISWSSILSGIQGTRGEPGAVEGQFRSIRICKFDCLICDVHIADMYTDIAACL